MQGLGESLEKKAMDKGIAYGMERGRELQLMELVQSGDFSIEKASEKLGVTVVEFEKRMQTMKK